MNLNAFNTKSLFDAATDLFQQLGIKLNSNTTQNLSIKETLKGYYKDNDTFNAIENTFFVGIIEDSVFREETMFETKYSYQDALKEGSTKYDGLMIFALDSNKPLTRTDISELTRAFNRISQKMPVGLLLKYTVNQEAVISIAISERFKYLQQWRQGERAGKVIILRDIRTKTPHAGHLRILKDLSDHNAKNFNELHQHWLEVLDVNILNKKFFQELSNWYFAATNVVSFPDDLEKNQEIRNATNLIRLITRIIFVWFLKEKQLIPENLFDKNFIASILKDFNKSEKSHSYYNAILQNLFFATLNQNMNDRKFAKEGDFNTNREEYGVKNLFRYADLFAISEKDVLNLFKDIPFLNGGLFDCLDKPNDKGKIEYVDGFSREKKKQAIVPDYLFFGEEKEIDLNKIYDTKNKRYTFRGLINLLESYKFTVAENTPIEEEVALDPELLGKVFENLLANYNPETQTTARKQTGSFYTPREIVDYMVNESLFEYLKSAQSTVSIPADIPADIPTDIPADDEDNNNLYTFFNPYDEIDIYHGNLPHWRQENVWYFVTFRLADSLPHDVVEQIKSQRELWLKQHNIPTDTKQRHQAALKTLSKAELKEYYRLFSEQIETWLNAGKGSCVLKEEKIARIVANALLHFNHQRYILDEWVIMPNHVHVLVKPLGNHQLSDILHSWKSFTANEINKQLGRKGQLWMHESYDHIVRNERAFEAIRKYIRENPLKAKLSVGEFLASEQTTRSTDASDTFAGTRSTDASMRSTDASDTFEARLRDLLSYSDNPNPFNETETKALINALNNCKILDPACGSGAFPMGILHKMVHILQKLDPDNHYWKELQRQKALQETEQAFKIGDKEERAKRLAEINDIFENNASDYGRKLYLIENCIYGIDLQPIAVQIAKLRFFISLVIDQKVDKNKENFGIRSLPNLETKFVAANALINLDKSRQIQLRSQEIVKKESELQALRHNYFTATTRKEKLHLQKQDKQLRQELVELLKKDGWENTVAQQIADFDPYDQNKSANWFDPEWMFGVTDGFDIMIGNPPYISTKGIDSQFKKILENQYGFADDIYNHFYFKGLELLKDKGILSYISSKTFWTIQTKKNLRDLLLKNKLLLLFDTANPFEAAMVDTCVTIVQKQSPDKEHTIIFLDGKKNLTQPEKYTIQQEVYASTPNNVFFIPTAYNLKIYKRLGKNVNELLNQWWDKISTSKKIEKHKKLLEQYRNSLKPGDITLLGLITEGGQGLATGNNGKFVGVLEGTKWAEKVKKERPVKLLLAAKFCKQQRITSKQQAQDYLEKLSEKDIRNLFDTLKEQYRRDIFGQGWLYRIVSKNEIADVEKLTEDEKLNGIAGDKTFVPYDKGDKDGNRWYAPTPYYIDWSRENVKILQTDPKARWQGYQFYFREGFCWNNVLSDEKIKCRLKEKSVHSTEAMTFISLIPKIASDRFLICLMNSTFFGNYRMDFINVSHHLTTGDAKEFPIIIPTAEELKIFESIFNRAYEIQKQKFANKISESEAEKQLEIIQKELDEIVEKMYMGE